MKCSFCGKDHSEVLKLIAGQNCYICNECVVLCSHVLMKECSRDLKTKAIAIRREATKRQSEPGPASNGGHVAAPGNSGVTERPPSAIP